MVSGRNSGQARTGPLEKLLVDRTLLPLFFSRRFKGKGKPGVVLWTCARRWFWQSALLAPFLWLPVPRRPLAKRRLK